MSKCLVERRSGEFRCFASSRETGQSCLPNTTTPPPHSQRAYGPHHAPLHRHAILVLFFVVVFAWASGAQPRLSAQHHALHTAFRISPFANTIMKRRAAAPRLVLRQPHPRTDTHQHRTWPHSLPSPGAKHGRQRFKVWAVRSEPGRALPKRR